MLKKSGLFGASTADDKPRLFGGSPVKEVLRDAGVGGLIGAGVGLAMKKIDPVSAVLAPVMGAVTGAGLARQKILKHQAYLAGEEREKRRAAERRKMNREMGASLAEFKRKVDEVARMKQMIFDAEAMGLQLGYRGPDSGEIRRLH